jgi:hypothetical protein
MLRPLVSGTIIAAHEKRAGGDANHRANVVGLGA